MWFFSMLYKFVLSFVPVGEILDCVIQFSGTILYYIPFVVLFKVALKFQVLLSNERYSALLSCDSVVISFKFMSTSGSSNQLKLVEQYFFFSL